MITQSTKLNLIPGGIPEVIKVSQYDAGSRTISFQLYNGTTPFTSAGLSAQIRGTKPDKHGFAYDATYSAGVVSFAVRDQMTAVAGPVDCEIVLISGQEVLGTANFTLEVEKAALNNETDISDTELPAIIDLARSNAEAAATSATAAAASATAAATSATAAAGSATTASTKASEAATSATNAAGSATTATTAATTATTKAGEASTSATAAAGSATAAEGSAEDSEAWAVGTKDGTPVQSTDPQYNNHAKYWAAQAQSAAQGGLYYKGAVTFSGIPTSGMVNGDMYNVLEAFTTDNRFVEGSGKYCERGTNIIWDGDNSLWDIGGAIGGMQSFNGRHGDVTPQANDYTAQQIKYGSNSNVDDELMNKQPMALFTPLDIGGASRTTVESALGALNTFKPSSSSLGTAAWVDVPQSGNASENEVVKGDDTRLTDSRNAADVYSWAKASSKPSYTASEVGALASNTTYAGSSSVGGAATSANKVNNKLKIIDAHSNIYNFDGSTDRVLSFPNKKIGFMSYNWSNLPDSDGYYTNTVGTDYLYNTYCKTDVNLVAYTEGNQPTSDQIAAYNLIDQFYMPTSTDASTITAKAKTKPTATFYVNLSGTYIGT